MLPLRVVPYIRADALALASLPSAAAALTDETQKMDISIVMSKQMSWRRGEYMQHSRRGSKLACHVVNRVGRFPLALGCLDGEVKRLPHPLISPVTA